MCIVIDTNSIASVFNMSSKKHNQFKPVLTWIIYGSGKIVFGGSKYKNELIKTSKYLPIFSELEKVNKTYVPPTDEIDSLQKEIDDMITDPDFDDPHIPAIIIASKCRLICSDDKRAYPYFRRKDIYPTNIKRPSIYSSSKNENLLCDKYIDEFHKPTNKLSKKQSEPITELINKIST